MLHLVQSNKMSVLAGHLTTCLKDHQGKGAAPLLAPLRAPNILVQSPGMAQWLKLTIAEQLGIAANLNFPLPSSYIWELYKKQIAGLPEQSSFTKPNLTWKLMSILPDFIEQDGFEGIRKYLEDDNMLKRYQLCHKIADVFDQYLVYRPEWILSWEQGIDVLDEVDVTLHPWQPVLWRALVAYSNKLRESPYHRANLHLQLLERLSENTAASDAPLYVFGISALPRQQLEILSALAETTEVYVFWSNPSQHYWGDIVDAKTLGKIELADAERADYMDVGNPLLASWGKLGRDYQDMLLNLDVQQHDDFVDQQPTCLLAHIQSEVLNLTHRQSGIGLSPLELLSNGSEYPKIPLSQDDDSVSLHACHSPVRELEVLQDHLLQLFNDDPDLTPADIIVMMPDVAAYAPLIEGVFGASEKSAYIPFAISDRNASEESPLIGSFLQLMKLHQSRFSLSEILAVLEVSDIRRKVSMTEAEFELLKVWLAEAGVRWGWDEQDKQRWSLPLEKQNTWLFGLKRLLAGYAVYSDGLLVGRNGVIAPYNDVEGQQAIALGKLGQFCDLLLEAFSFCRTQQTLSDKTSGALAILDMMYDISEDEQVYANQLRQAIEQIDLHASQFSDVVTQDVFVSELEQNLTDKGVGQRFLAGSVNFCTLMPMRSIPFKVVCLLGMNDGDYPRQTTPTGFDLMRFGKSRKGDRSRRWDDRYLFLEALLSAQQKLFISYQGFSQKDNSERSPSVLVSELVEYCEQCFCLQGDELLKAKQTRDNLAAHLMRGHYLQPFNEQYFLSGNRQSFNRQWLDVASLQKEGAQAQLFFDAPLVPLVDDSIHKTTSDAHDNELDLDDFIRFYENPIKALFRHRWQTSLDIYHTELTDEEPFALDPLSRYQLNGRMVEEASGDLRERLKAEGQLPTGAKSALIYDDIRQQSDKILDAIEQLKSRGQARRIEIDLAFEQCRLVGWCDGIHGGNLIRWRSGKVRTKDKLSLLIEWMCICACADDNSFTPDTACYVGTDGQFSLDAVSPEEARAYVKGLIDIWARGTIQPVFFFPETSWQWMKTFDDNKAVQAFVGNRYQPGEGSDPHIARACPDLRGVFNEFTELSERVWSPLFSEQEE